MKLAPRDASAYFARPNPPKPGLLIYGEDPMRVALKRQEVILAMIGPEGEAEMRLARHDAADLRKDPALVSDAMRAAGFFPGPRAVLIDGGDRRPDRHARRRARRLEGRRRPPRRHRRPTPPRLETPQALRDPPRRLRRRDLRRPALPRRNRSPSSARPAPERSPARRWPKSKPSPAPSTPATSARPIEKLALYKRGDATPVTPADVAAVAPTSTEADLDDVIDIVAEGRTAEIGPFLRRLEAQGATAVGLCIAATRHFRTLHAAAADPEGPARALARARVNFKRKDRMTRQAQTWGAVKAGEAIHLLTDADLTLRSSSRAPDMALVERTLIRLSMLGKR